MYTVVLVVNLLICLALIGLVLLQRSEGGALGMGGGGAGSLMSGRGAADALAKMTYVAGGLFLACSFLLTFMAGASRTAFDRSILDQLTPPAATAPAPTPQRESSAPLLAPAPAEGAAPAQVTPATGPQPAASTGPTAPAPTQAAARAGPVAPTTSPPRAGPASPAPRVAAPTQPAAEQPRTAAPRPAATGATPARQAATTQPPRPRPAVTQTPSESVETPPPDLPPLRPRAGPDQ